MHDDPALRLGLSLGISLELIRMEAVKGNVEPGRLREGGRYMNYEAKAACTFYPFKGSNIQCRITFNLYDAQ